MKFDWDPEKATVNLKKHGVSLEHAITAFDDPFGLVAPDSEHSTPTEVREWLIGASDIGVVIVIFTIRQPGNVYRIISAWKASRNERRRYEENKGISI